MSIKRLRRNGEERMTAPTPREVNERDHAVQDDADNVRPDYPDLAAVERECDELRAKIERLRASERGLLENLLGVKARAEDFEGRYETAHDSRMHAERVLERTEAEVARLRAECADRESERADLRDRLTKAEATVARVEALVDGADPAFGAVTLADLRAALEGQAG